MSGLIHLSLVDQGLAETDQATNMDDLDHTGFSLGTSRIEFQTLDSKNVQGILKIIPREFRRKLDVPDENSMDEEVLDNLHKMQLEKSSLMKNALSLY